MNHCGIKAEDNAMDVKNKPMHPFLVMDNIVTGVLNKYIYKNNNEHYTVDKTQQGLLQI